MTFVGLLVSLFILIFMRWLLWNSGVIRFPSNLFLLETTKIVKERFEEINQEIPEEVPRRWRLETGYEAVWARNALPYR